MSRLPQQSASIAYARARRGWLFQRPPLGHQFPGIRAVGDFGGRSPLLTPLYDTVYTMYPYPLTSQLPTRRR